LVLLQTLSPLKTATAKDGEFGREKGGREGKQRSVLYIEDNLSNLKLIEHLLDEETNLHLVSAMQGSIGLDIARKQLPDLILLDLHLPDMPAWEVLAALKEGETTRHIPTVVVSADATPGQCKRLLDAGARNYITKPIEVPHFYRVMDEIARELECVGAEG
jgi:CheY-like chemotaxis protein